MREWRGRGFMMGHDGVGDNAYAPRPFDLRLCLKIRTTSTSNHHHQQPLTCDRGRVV